MRETELGPPAASAALGSRLARFAHRHAGFIFPAPAVLTVALVIVYPVLYTGWVSLQEWVIASTPRPRFIGLANYQHILTQDDRFHGAFLRTLYFTAITVTAETVLGIGMALLFNREFRGRGLIRTLSILPMVATPTAIALVFVMMYHPTLGVVNYLLSTVGIGRFMSIYSSGTVLFALALVDVWEWTPLVMLIVLAGLAALPAEPYESALIDGASTLQSFWHITLPLLRPIIIVAVLFRAIDALKTFDIIYVMTQGGPGNASETINILLFNQAFSYFNMGYSAAVAVALFTVVMGISLVLMKVRRVGW